MQGLLTFAIYMAPSLIAWYRTRTGQPVQGPLAMLVLVNFFVGWTVVGWLLPLASAFGYNPVAWVTVRIVNALGTPGPAMNVPEGQATSSSAQAARCFQCHGSGSTSCSTCGGRGSWYDAPQGESGVAQLRTCSACMSSGHVRCMTCGGSGRAALSL